MRPGVILTVLAVPNHATILLTATNSTFAANGKPVLGETSEEHLLRKLKTLNNVDRLADPDFTRPMEPRSVMDAAFTMQYNILQSIILHDQIVVDSILIDSDPEVRKAIELCPDIIRGVYFTVLRS